MSIRDTPLTWTINSCKEDSQFIGDRQFVSEKFVVSRKSVGNMTWVQQEGLLTCQWLNQRGMNQTMHERYKVEVGESCEEQHEKDED